MTRVRSVSFFLIGLLGHAAIAAGPIDPNNPPEGLFSDQWTEVYMGGGKIGYGHATMGRHGDLIHTSMTMYMRIGRVGQPVEVSMTKTTTETLAGVPRAFTAETTMASVVTSSKGVIEDGKVTYTYADGKKQTLEAGSVVLSVGMRPKNDLVMKYIENCH